MTPKKSKKKKPRKTTEIGKGPGQGTKGFDPHAHAEYHGDGGSELDPLKKRDFQSDDSHKTESPRPSPHG